MSQSIVPSQWKSSCIIPIKKISSPMSPSDFRPISITPVLSRLTERIVLSTYVYPALLSPVSTLYFGDQYAFRPSGSTTNALITLYHKISFMLTTCAFVRVIALDFSKAFDSIKHSALFNKYANLNLPHCIHNWLVDFFTGRQHCTKYGGVTSALESISASVIQGSALGPVSFAVTASDLRPIYDHNEILKFADDTYLIIPSLYLDTTVDELNNIDDWSASNNLHLNRSKSNEILFYSSHSKFMVSVLPPPINNIVRVSSLKCLGVVLQSYFSFSDHISAIINNCASNLYALRILRAKGLSSDLIAQIFKSTVLSKLTYASQFWWGFLGAKDKDRIEAFLRKASRCGFFNGSVTFSEIAESADEKLFTSIVNNPQHVLFPLLPAQRGQFNQKLRARAHNFCLPAKTVPVLDKNFIIRMLYKNCY